MRQRCSWDEPDFPHCIIFSRPIKILKATDFFKQDMKKFWQETKKVLMKPKFAAFVISIPLYSLSDKL